MTCDSIKWVPCAQRYHIIWPTHCCCARYSYLATRTQFYKFLSAIDQTASYSSYYPHPLSLCEGLLLSVQVAHHFRPTFPTYVAATSCHCYDTAITFTSSISFTTYKGGCSLRLLTNLCLGSAETVKSWHASISFFGLGSA